MKPTIGRIVIYNHPGSADGKYKSTQSPAIIQAVADDGSCTLFVFRPKGQHMDMQAVETAQRIQILADDGPCQWDWPVYEKKPEVGHGR